VGERSLNALLAIALVGLAALWAVAGSLAEVEQLARSAWAGFLLVVSWPNVLYPIAATLLAMIFALFPGLSGATLMALAISLTLSWDRVPLVLVFGAFVGGATFMGSVTAILFNIPGTAASAATLIDGHPLARQGEARTAIGCSAASSALGSSFGVLALVALLPFLRRAALAFGPAELLMMTVWGLTTIAVITQASVVKGLVTTGLGFLLSFVGQDPRTAEPRYTLGLLYLWEGLSLVPIVLGIFSVGEMLDLATSGRRTISGKTRADQLSGSVWSGARTVFKHPGLLMRSSAIGTAIGIIPGVGGTVASFVAYAHAVQSAGDRRRFGRGDIRGVIAPEAAHDAKDGGSLVPALAFGIPGSEGTALLLAAMVLHGLVPGKELLTEHLDLVFALIWSLFLSNWLTSILGVALVTPLARLTVVRTQLITPVILVLTAVGAYAFRNRIEDVVVAFGFGFVGYLLKKHGWPRIPFVIAFVLGNLFETNFLLTLRLQSLDRIDVFTRPLVLILGALTLVNLASPFVRTRRSARADEE
jgi:putative tricarboxylic transport membrane protein